MELQELRKLVAEERKRVEAAAKKRNTIAILAFIGVYLLLFLFLNGKPDDFNKQFSLVFSAVFAGITHHAINGAVYEALFSKGKAERCYLEKLQKELHEKEQELFQKQLAETMKNIPQRR